MREYFKNLTQWVDVVVMEMEGGPRSFRIKTEPPYLDKDGEVQDLPEPEEGVTLIVVDEIARAAKGRKDLLVPKDIIRFQWPHPVSGVSVLIARTLGVV